MGKSKHTLILFLGTAALLTSSCAHGQNQQKSKRKIVYGNASVSLTIGAKILRTRNENVEACKARAVIKYPDEYMLEDCNKALADPKTVPHNRTASYYHRGLIKQNLGHHAAARQDYRNAIRLEPNFGDGVLAIASLDFLDYQYDQVLQKTELALTKELTNPAYAYYLLGNVYEDQFEFPAARQAFARALALRPNWRTAKTRLAFIDRNWPAAHQKN